MIERSTRRPLLRAIVRPIVRAIFGLLLPALTLGGCWFYSFSGATIPTHLGTIAIPLVEDRSVSTVTTLGDQMTQLLVERFVRRTRLSLLSNPEAADAVLRARIERYQNQPTSVSGAERATLNRVTITMAIEYQDQVENREMMRRTFTGFAEYDPFDPGRGLSGEEDAAAAALEKIADDVFTAATSNW